MSETLPEFVSRKALAAGDDISRRPAASVWPLTILSTVRELISNALLSGKLPGFQLACEHGKPPTTVSVQASDVAHEC